MRITRKLFYFTVASLALSVLALIFTRKTSELFRLALLLSLRMGSDSSRFMNHAWDTFKSGQPLYQTLFFTQHVKFIYPTSSLLLYWFAHAVHLSGSFLIKPIVLLSLLGTLYFAGKVFVYKASETSPLSSTEQRNIRLMIALLGFLFYPLVYGAYIGQIQTLLTFFWTLAVWAWITNRKSLAGLAIALVCVFKPTLAVFVLWAVLRREWRFFAFLSGTLAVVQIVSIALFGWRNELDYFAVLSYISHHGEAFIPNQTINGVLERYTRNGNMAVWSDNIYPPYNRLVYLGTVISSAIMLLFGLLAPVLARWKDRALDVMLFGMLSTVASPIAWEHHYGYFFVPSIYLLASIFSQRRLLPIVFTASFMTMSTSWVFLNYLSGTRWDVFLNFYLVAGIGMIAVTVWELERHGKRDRTKQIYSESFEFSDHRVA